MLTKEDITRLFSEAYANAAAADKFDMRIVADLFETTRLRLQIDKPYETWELMELESLKFDTPECINLMVELRDAYYYLFLNKQIDLLEETQKNYPDKLPELWNQFFSEAAVYIQDNYLAVFSLFRKNLSVSGLPETKPGDVVTTIRENRWVDMKPLYESIAANQKLNNKIRSRAELILAQIIFFYQEDISEVDMHINNSISLTPDDYFTGKIKADYLSKTGKSSEARTQLFHLTAQHPTDFNLYISIGDTYMAEGQLQLAESWYQDAIKINCLQYESYKRLINVIADQSLFQTRESELETMLLKINERLMFKDNGATSKISISDDKCFLDMALYQSYRDIASAWYASDNQEKSKLWYQKAVGLFPYYTPALIDLGYVALQYKEREESNKYFNQALSLNENNFEIHEGFANYYKVQNQIPEAMHACDLCLNIRPSWKHYVFNLKGNIYYYLGKYEESIPFYRNAIAENNRIQTYKNNLAGALQEVADGLEGADTFEKGEAMYSEAAGILQTAEIWNLFGNFYFKHEKWEKAIEQYDRAIAIKQDEWVYYDNKGQAYEKLENKQGAEQAYIEAAANDLSGSADNKLGNFYYNQNEPDKALAAYKKAAEKNPDEPVYIENMGFVYNKTGDYFKAIEAYQKVVDSKKAKLTTLNALGLNYFRANILDKAIQYYKLAIQGDPVNWIYFTNLALAQKQNMQYDQAIASYEVALQLNKNDYLNWNELGILYYNKNIPDKAIYCYDQAINIKPDDPVLYMNKALALIQQNKSDDAKSVIDNAPEAEDTRKKAKELWLQNFGDNI